MPRLFAALLVAAAALAAEPPPFPTAFAIPAEGLRSPGDHRLVLPHYFPPFPLSLDNQPPERDYYARAFLDPEGENGKHRKAGGYLRQRPLPRPPWPDADREVWRWRNLCEEVLIARALGCDGFTVDILSTSQAKDPRRWRDLVLLLEAARVAAPGFRILPMPDMNAEYLPHPERLAPSVLALADHPALLRLADGRLALTAYNAQRQSPGFYRAVLDRLALAGVQVAFVPVFQAWWMHAEAYAPVAVGMGDWGCAVPGEEIGDVNRATSPQQAHARGLRWFAPVRPQDFRPKATRAWEAGGSRLYDAMWATARRGAADWVQVVTWNDYGEGSEIAPSTGTGCALAMWTQRHAAWYRTGAEPVPARDAIAWCHRIHRLADSPMPFTLVGPPCDEAEVTAILTAPATLVWTDGAGERRHDLPAGVTTLRAPLVPGELAYRLERAGAEVLAVRDPAPVQAAPARTDLLYRWGSSLEDEQRVWLAALRAQVAALVPPADLGKGRDLAAP